MAPRARPREQYRLRWSLRAPVVVRVGLTRFCATDNTNNELFSSLVVPAAGCGGRGWLRGGGDDDDVRGGDDAHARTALGSRQITTTDAITIVDYDDEREERDRLYKRCPLVLVVTVTRSTTAQEHDGCPIVNSLRLGTEDTARQWEAPAPSLQAPGTAAPALPTPARAGTPPAVSPSRRQTAGLASALSSSAGAACGRAGLSCISSAQRVGAANRCSSECVWQHSTAFPSHLRSSSSEAAASSRASRFERR